jgi:hypothetical protein
MNGFIGYSPVVTTISSYTQRISVTTTHEIRSSIYVTTSSIQPLSEFSSSELSTQLSWTPVTKSSTHTLNSPGHQWLNLLLTHSTLPGPPWLNLLLTLKSPGHPWLNLILKLNSPGPPWLNLLLTQLSWTPVTKSSTHALNSPGPPWLNLLTHSTLLDTRD